MGSLTPVLDTLDKKRAKPTPRRRFQQVRERDLSGAVRPIDRKRPLERLREQPLSYGAAVLLCVVMICAVAAPLLSPHTSDAIDIAKRHLPPSANHPFGTDDMGRDLFVRVMEGGRISISVGISAMVFALLIGVIGGGVAGYFGGVLDSIVMRATDLVMSIPVLLIILLCSSIFSPGFLLLCLFIGSIQWMEVARVVRSVVLSTRENEYVEAARALGVSDVAILFRHVLPHTSGPVLVAATLGLAQAIMIETTLSFLGFGLQPPAVSWGSLLRNAQGYLATAPWVAIFPGLMIFLTVFCCYILGDFLRSTLDPRNGGLGQNPKRP